MSILEVILVGLSVFSVFGVVVLKLYDIFGREDLKSYFKYLKDESSPFPERAKVYFNIVEIILDDMGVVSKRQKKMVVLLNSSLLSAILRVYENSNDSKKKYGNSETIVGLMLQERLKNSTKLYVVLFGCLFLYLILNLVSVVDFSYILFSLFSFMILLTHVDGKLIDRRVRKGWYGKNEFEAREIIDFIISHSSTDDFNDSGGLKRVIPLPEVEPKKRDSSTSEEVFL